MSGQKKEKTIIQYGLVGLLVGLVSIIMYFMCGIFLNETVFFDLIYSVAMFFGKPLLLFYPQQQVTNCIFEGVIILSISALLGGLLYGIIIGGIVKGVHKIIKSLKGEVKEAGTEKNTKGV